MRNMKVLLLEKVTELRRQVAAATSLAEAMKASDALPARFLVSLQ